MNKTGHDLANRECVNFVVDSNLMNSLRSISKEKKIPMSRIIDSALSQYMAVLDATEEVDDAISLYHSLEVTVNREVKSEEMTNFLKYIEETFKNYIYTSCLIHYESGMPRMGTKVKMYISDRDNDKFHDFIRYVNEDKVMEFHIRLDNREIVK